MNKLLKGVPKGYKKVTSNEKGNTSILALMLVLLILVFGGALLLVVNMDFNNTYGSLLKSKSKTLVSYAVESYKDHIATEIESSNLHDIDSLTITDIPEQNITGESNYTINYPLYSSTSPLWDTQYTFLSSKNIASEFKTYSKNPNITNFKETGLFSDPDEDFKLSMDSIYNRSFKSNEYFLIKLKNEDPAQLINLYSYIPSTDGNTLDASLLTITEMELEGLAGTDLELDLNDDIKISSVWDENIKSPNILIAVTEKVKGKVHYFNFVPINYGSSDKQFLEHFQTIDVTEGDLREVEITSSFSTELNGSLFITSILVKASDGTYKNISYFTNLIGGTDKFKLNGDSIEYTSNTIRSMSVDSFYDEETKTWNIYWATLEDSTNISNNQIKLHSYVYGVDAAVKTYGSIDLTCDGGNSCLDGKLTIPDTSQSILSDVNITAAYSPHIKTGVAFINTTIKAKDYLGSPSDMIASIKVHTFEADKLSSGTLNYEIEELTGQRFGEISSSLIISDIPDLMVHADRMLVKDSYLSLQDVSELKVELWRGTELRSRTRIGFDLGVTVLTPVRTNLNKVETIDVNNLWVE
ncbi:hypothetical protein QTG56_23450 (plasmid) [Rossellomorea sp. AcN35-11]|nr:hypothetical protein [Rossellomorea aquimaris]WJV32321.1 hypothetical protein QTG56_23450 [Rossellomorea sp. AcN35-11]